MKRPPVLLAKVENGRPKEWEHVPTWSKWISVCGGVVVVIFLLYAIFGWLLNGAHREVPPQQTKDEPYESPLVEVWERINGSWIGHEAMGIVRLDLQDGKATLVRPQQRPSTTTYRLKMVPTVFGTRDRIYTKSSGQLSVRPEAVREGWRPAIVIDGLGEFLLILDDNDSTLFLRSNDPETFRRGYTFDRQMECDEELDEILKRLQNESD